MWMGVTSFIIRSKNATPYYTCVTSKKLEGLYEVAGLALHLVPRALSLSMAQRGPLLLINYGLFPNNVIYY